MAFYEAVRGLQSDILSVSKQDSELSDALDAVVFDVWARGFLELGRMKSIGLTYFSILLNTVFDIASVPLLILRLVPVAALAVVASTLILWAFDSAPAFREIGCLSIAIIIFQRFGDLEFSLKSILWNLTDLVTAGAVTRYYVKRYWRLGRSAKLGAHDKRKEWLHLNRIIVTSVEMEEELYALSQFCSSASDDQERAWQMIMEYWDDGTEVRQFWRYAGRQGRTGAA